MNDPLIPPDRAALPDFQDGQFFAFKDDVIFTPLVQEGCIVWMNGRHPFSNGAFILATAVSDEAEADATRLLKNEFILRPYLSDAWAVKPAACTQYRGRYALVYPSFAFDSLARITGQPMACIASFLELAIRICAPLRQMHRHNLIHGDIKPGNIFIQGDTSCRLAGFGLTTGTAEELKQTRLPFFGGTLAYMSPEHTSRTQRSVDSRSDLYSLGIVFYELLTGSLPFDLSEGGLAEWAHHHIASEPRPPHLLREQIPAMLSTLVLRLLAKSPDNRYQTVDGLVADLRRCQATLTDDNDIMPFPPGLQDRAPEFHLADTLYTLHPQGRELVAAFDKVNQSGTHALAVISGPSGIGKSSLIASALKELKNRRTLLAVGKVDQFSSSLPYGVLTSAFRTLTLKLLGLPAEDVALWKTRLARTLDGYEGLAINLVPELGLLLERKSRQAPDSLSTDARARFNLMIVSLVNTFATPGCPLVLLIDDIHWIDAASLQVLEYLLKNSDALPLLLVVALRDPSSTDNLSASEALGRLRDAAQRKIDIIPAPLSVKAVARWLADVFQRRSTDTLDLARLIHEKTGGNPLFVHEFFKRIVDDGLVTHNKYQGKWYYDVPTIQARHYTENVVGLVLQQLEKMPEETRKLLGSLACLGSSGELGTISRVLNLSDTDIRYQLHPAVTAQLITLSADTYTFPHDRVQEAAFALLDAGERGHLHLTTASLLAEASRQAAGNEMLFRAIHHVSAAIDCVQPPQQRKMFRELSMLAARRAKRSGDYLSAQRYLQTARALGGPVSDSAADFALELEEAECAFLLGNLVAARHLSDRLLASPGGLAEKISAANLLAEVHMRQSDNPLALETALCWLTVSGITLNRHPDDAECETAWKMLHARIGDSPAAIFNQLPLMANPETEAAMSLLARAGLSASFISPRLHFMLLCQMLHLTLEHGITGASTSAMGWFGVLIGHRYAEYRLGFKYAVLARELVTRHGYSVYEAKTLLPLDQLSVWTQPLSYTTECAKACFTAAVTHGDLTVASFAACHQIINFLSRGDHLDNVLTSIERGLAFVRKSHFPDVERIMLIQRHYVEHLRGASPGAWGGVDALPDSLLPTAPEQAPQQMSTMMFWFWLYRGMTHFVADEYPQAEESLKQAESFSWSAPGHIHLLDLHLYSALTLSAQLTPDTFSVEHRRKLQKHHDKIALWARINPGTFADKEALVYAEIVRLDGMNSIALEQYEKAVRLSRDSGFNPSNALAHELAGRFALSCGYHTAADAHFRGAMAAWGRAGAQAKVNQLKQAYPHLVSPGQATPYDTIAFAQNEEIRDLQSVIKASRALSEEINLERLIQILMTMLLERAGAQRGLLIRILDNNIPEIEASAYTGSDGVRVRIIKDVPMATDMPLSVLSAVIRTGQEIRTGKPEEFSPFSQDPYLVTSGAAVLCVPMFKQARLVGVLYLENRLMPEIFTAEHSKVVNLLGAHAAVSLETARLYAELLEENIQRRRVEKELRSSQTSLMLGEQISHTGSWRWELEQDLMFMSEEYARILGLPEKQKMISMAEFLTFVHPDDYARVSTVVTDGVRDGQPLRAEFRIMSADGVCRYILGIGNPVGVGTEVYEYYGTITDITAQRQTEDAVRVAQAELARVSRATTVGQLTSSIAHEINQPLMSIVSNAGASLRWLNHDPVRHDNIRTGLEEIIAEGQRAGEIIRSLQTLTRKQEPVFSRIDLHYLVRHIMTLSRSEIEQRRVAVEYELKAADSFIFGDSIQIQQVLINLVMNAIEALSEVSDRARTLRITTLNPDDGRVELRIMDNGVGLDPDVMERVFDSFYTTKAQGMGMGLTISHAIIERHRGALKAQAAEPCGSCFSFVVPTAGNESAIKPQ
ncbi:ATP-binding sensor histidine kinase [Serratia plymuthica]|uniref:ATP-binding sensor histidine kinase n=1 Tax=Serratia plymuthica TaxID=82996 RepID=UPI0004567690|nr:ATP-binding sensor histidine kinase [Serratia plymuthica]AHY08041.1 histidine kinase [Serratia plymuthica]